MSDRLDKDREEKLQPKRMEFAVKELEKLNLEIIGVESTKVKFKFKESLICFYPYSGWHTGKTIQDGGGWRNLEKQLKSE